MPSHRRRSASRDPRKRVAVCSCSCATNASPTREAQPVEPPPISKARESSVFSKVLFGALLSILGGVCLIVSIHLRKSLLDKPYRSQ
ncbi:hypothetical protein V5799_023460 [Amblyomma americanum]|uniref:Uncharacterized protein n=1 Tax=Amblyomma americanum TaxID=6943 RepID=A0AAQ4FIC4_AMBAM